MMRTTTTIRPIAMNFWTTVLAVAIAAAFTACGANDGILKSGKPDPNAANAAPKPSRPIRFVFLLRSYVRDASLD